MLPKDPFILLSTINTKLRDFHDSFDDLCISNDYNHEEILNRLAQIDYYYDPQSNQFK